ncbi:hypothetical protein AURDEDRAFT_171248 [Auricularia subglabra TFB-10046 SS5]|nr:hypothetical protein AURDEDRAFT_171248 [Auricularia subglabra TFB-10046 SS5]
MGGGMVGFSTRRYGHAEAGLGAALLDGIHGPTTAEERLNPSGAVINIVTPPPSALRGGVSACSQSNSIWARRACDVDGPDMLAKPSASRA